MTNYYMTTSDADREASARQANVTDAQRSAILAEADRTPRFEEDTDRDYYERVFNNLAIDHGDDAFTLSGVHKVLAGL